MNTAEIPGCPGYTATKTGDILNSKGKVLRQWRESVDGAFRVRVAGRNRMVHYLVLTAFTGVAPKGYRARHRNGNLADNGIDNLFWAAPKSEYRTQSPTVSREFERAYEEARLERLALIELMQT